MTILDGGQYRAPEGGLGNYTYDHATRTVRWTSGPFADRSVSAQFYRRPDGRSAIKVAPATGSEDPSQTNDCVLN